MATQVWLRLSRYILHLMGVLVPQCFNPLFRPVSPRHLGLSLLLPSLHLWNSAFKTGDLSVDATIGGCWQFWILRKYETFCGVDIHVYLCILISIYIHRFMLTCIHIRIYIYMDRFLTPNTCICVFMCMYIYMSGVLDLLSAYKLPLKPETGLAPENL